MTRKGREKSEIYKYFKLEDSYFVCQIRIHDCICGVKISSFTTNNISTNVPTRASNLKRHVERCHPILSQTLNIKKEVQEADTLKRLAPTSSQSPSTKYLKSGNYLSDKITISMTSDIFKENLINMVVKDNVPLSFFENSAFLALNGEMAEKLGIQLTNDYVRNLILDTANEKKALLKSIIKSQLIYLKIDEYRLKETNYIGINTQFVKKNKICTNTLAIKETKVQHPSDFLTVLLLDTLREFGIKIQHVLTIIEDNAIHLENTSVNWNECSLLGSQSNRTDVGANDIENRVDLLGENVASHLKVPYINSTSHILHLAIRDGLQDPAISKLLLKVRSAVAILCAPQNDAILKQKAGKGVIIDHITRWGTTYLMIQRLLELKPFILEFELPGEIVSDLSWDRIAELEIVLNKPFEINKLLQDDNLTPGLFLKLWKQVIFELTQNGGVPADALKNSMIRKENLILDNDVFLAAIYIDPLHRILLSDDQIFRGKQYFCQIGLRLYGLGSDDFDMYLDEQESKKFSAPEAEPDTDTIGWFKENFKQGLKTVESFNRYCNMSVMEAIPLYPKIAQDSAYAVTALPQSHFTVNRLFSALKILKSDMRRTLKDDVLDAIVFLCTNNNNL